MTPSQRTRIASLAVGTAAATGLGMIPVHRLPRPVRAGYVLLPAMLTTGVSLLAAQGRLDPTGDDAPSAHGLRPPTLPATAVALVVGGLLAGAGVAGLRLDRGAERFLRRRGVPAPRVWLGLATGAATLTMTLLDRPDVDDQERPLEQDLSELGTQVLALLNEEDPMGLLPGIDDEPGEDYEAEAEAIADLLRTGTTPTAADLDAIWEEWFSEPLSPLLGTDRMEALLEALGERLPEDHGA